MGNQTGLLAVAPTSTPQSGAPRSQGKQVSAEVTATLCAELEGRVPPGLVAEVVNAILDEGRQGTQACVAELTLLEARARLERFIRARASR